MTDSPEAVLKLAISKGASDAEVFVRESVSTNVRVRLGEVELVEQASQKALGLRVFFGERSAVTSTTDLSSDSLARLVDQTVERARISVPVEHAGLPAQELYVGVAAELNI